MKKLLLILVTLSLAGCANMTERERQTVWIVGGVLVAGAAIAASNGGSSASCRQFIVVRGDGSSDHVCR
jgi:uncharacterized lipoprotein NlpE involved in copper resistance